MTVHQKQLCKALWDIANDLRDAMNTDDLIAAQSQKTETLKVHKKGLMQQLFPNVNDSAL